MARVGEEIEQKCTTCKTLRGHTVAAIEGGVAAAFVCNYCKKRTAPRRARSGARASRPGAPARSARSRVAAPVVPLREPDPSAAKPYRFETIYGVGDTIRHPTFGLGVVESVTIDRKIHVRFGESRRVLVAGR
ncbi:MAG: hypothetical protein AABZ30_14170 [Myxococcota bacterium]